MRDKKIIQLAQLGPRKLPEIGDEVPLLRDLVRDGEERAIVKNGKIEIAHIMSVTLSCDHRAVDGALGAELIGAFKALIENPVMMVV